MSKDVKVMILETFLQELLQMYMFQLNVFFSGFVDTLHSFEFCLGSHLEGFYFQHDVTKDIKNYYLEFFQFHCCKMQVVTLIPN